MVHPDKPFGVIVWDDAHGASNEEYRESDIPHAAAPYQTYGWIVRSDSKGITIAAEWNKEDKTFRSTTFIPRPMVREEVLLRLVKKTNRAAPPSAVTRS